MDKFYRRFTWTVIAITAIWLSGKYAANIKTYDPILEVWSKSQRQVTSTLLWAQDNIGLAVDFIKLKIDDTKLNFQPAHIIEQESRPSKVLNYPQETPVNDSGKKLLSAAQEAGCLIDQTKVSFWWEISKSAHDTGSDLNASQLIIKIIENLRGADSTAMQPTIINSENLQIQSYQYQNQEGIKVYLTTQEKPGSVHFNLELAAEGNALINSSLMLQAEQITNSIGQVQTHFTVSGYRPGQIARTEQEKIINKLLSQLKAQIVARQSENGALSIFAHSEEVPSLIPLVMGKSNLQIAQRYHGVDNRTYFHLGFPLLLNQF